MSGRMKPPRPGVQVRREQRQFHFFAAFLVRIKFSLWTFMVKVRTLLGTLLPLLSRTGIIWRTVHAIRRKKYRLTYYLIGCYKLAIWVWSEPQRGE